MSLLISSVPQRSNGGDADVNAYNRFLVDLGSGTFKIYAFATSDSEIKVEYV